MAKSRNRKGKKFNPKKSQRLWLVGFSLVWDRALDGNGEDSGMAIPCYKRKRTEFAKITWEKNYKALEDECFNWSLWLYADFDAGDGKPYREEAEADIDNIRLMDLMAFCDKQRDDLLAAGNIKFLKNWGWSAEIRPDASQRKSYRKTTADRLERLIERESKK